MLSYTVYLHPTSTNWVTFVHGAGGSSSIWFKQIRYFQKDFNVLLLDLRGHGKSNPKFFKAFNKNSVEIKRMFTSPETRGKGIATLILKELENWASELDYSICVLETGIRQTEAVALYRKNSYKIISNYGQYEGIENSLCFEKNIKT